MIVGNKESQVCFAGKCHLMRGSRLPPLSRAATNPMIDSMLLQGKLRWSEETMQTTASLIVMSESEVEEADGPIWAELRRGDLFGAHSKRVKIEDRRLFIVVRRLAENQLEVIELHRSNRQRIIATTKNPGRKRSSNLTVKTVSPKSLTCLERGS